MSTLLRLIQTPEDEDEDEGAGKKQKGQNNTRHEEVGHRGGGLSGGT